MISVLESCRSVLGVGVRVHQHRRPVCWFPASSSPQFFLAHLLRDTSILRLNSDVPGRSLELIFLRTLDDLISGQGSTVLRRVLPSISLRYHIWILPYSSSPAPSHRHTMALAYHPFDPLGSEEISQVYTYAE